MREKTVLLSTVLILLLGFFSYSEDYTGKYYTPISEKCDINGDGDVDWEDIQSVQYVMDGWKTFKDRPDLNGDGLIDEKDLKLIEECVAKRVAGRLNPGVRGNECVPGEIICAVGRDSSYYYDCVLDSATQRWVKSYQKVLCPNGEECVIKTFRNSLGINERAHVCLPKFTG